MAASSWPGRYSPVMALSGAISAARVADLERQLAVAEAARTSAEAARAEAESRLTTSEEARARLERMLAQLRRDKFGATSEKSDPDQQHLPFEDVEVAEGMLAEASDAAEKATGNEKKTARSSRRNKGHLPPHLERVEQVIAPDSTLCPCGCGEMVKVGEDRSERLDVIPARFRVLVTVRPKYLCRSCDGASHVQGEPMERQWSERHWRARPSGWCRAGCRRRLWWRIPWSPSSATTCHSTARRISTAGRASISTGPCWRPGRGARRSCWTRSSIT